MVWNPPPVPCPACGKNVNGHTPVLRALPSIPHDGDFSLCLYCGVWSVFAGSQLRLPTPEELNEIADSNECKKASFTWLLMNLKREKQ